MLNISLPSCTKVELWDLTVCIVIVMGPDSLHCDCGKWRKISKSRSDLDLGPTMPSIELVRDIFIYYNVF